APVNGGRNYKLTVVVTLKNSAICWKLRESSATSPWKGSDNARGADNQQERLPERSAMENPQRPHAELARSNRKPPLLSEMIWSDLHGDMKGQPATPIKLGATSNERS